MSAAEESAAEEIVAIVDQNNEVIDAVTRRRMRADGLIHRATYVLVLSRTGALLLQKRTQTKDMYPGYYDAAAGGVVLADENYEQSAAREVEEELGIRDVPLTAHLDFYFEDEHNHIWGRVFSCVYEGPLVLQAEEVESARFCDVNEVLAGRFEPVTPDSLEALRRFLEIDEGS